MDKTIKKEPADKQVLNTQIIPQETQLVNFDPEKQVEQATIAAKALMSVVSRKPKKVEFNGEQYLEFEDWQTIAQFYNHSVGIEWTKPIEEAGKVIGFEAKAILYHNGVVVGGAEAACMTDEGNWAKKPKFQLRSMAQTRAMAKALRSRFGFVAVLAGFKATPAEEMDGMAKSVNTPAPSAPKGYHNLYFCSEHDQTIGLVPAGVSKRTGKPYKAFYSCSVRGCKNPIVNGDGVRVRQHPETGEMVPDQVQEVDAYEVMPDKKDLSIGLKVEESAADKARRILNEKIPLNQGQQVKFDK